VRKLGLTAAVGLLIALLCAPVALAAFPGANGEIAYTLLVDPDPTDPVITGQTDAFAIVPGTFMRRNVTQTDSLFETNPSWSADGRRLVVKASSGSGGNGLLTMDDQGGDVDFVASVPGGHYPVFSPDGTKIAFGEAPSGNDNNYEVSVINTDGSGYTNLTQSPGVDLAPSWSPDGSRIAFNSARNGGFDIYTMNADGSDVQRVTTSTMALEPDWSPDGKRIAYMDGSGGSDGNIHVINADGTGDVSLGRPGYETDPVWSPDGTKLAFIYQAEFGATYEIYVMDADGGANLQRVTVSETHVGAPSWQPLQSQPTLCDEVSVTPSVLEPPDHRFVKVRLSARSSPSAEIRITGVTQDEPTGRVKDALPAQRPERVRIKAEATYGGDGRTYAIAFTASNGTSSCSGSVSVGVPRGQWPPAISSAPPSYDSFTPTAPH
jgi:TolB protein